MCVKIFLQSLEHEFAACILKRRRPEAVGCQFPSLFPSKPVQESLFRRNRPLPNRSRGSTTSSKVQTCQELAKYSSSTKQAACNEKTTSITVSTTIFQPRHAILTQAVFPRMDQEIKVFSFVPVLLTVVFKLQLK